MEKEELKKLYDKLDSLDNKIDMCYQLLLNIKEDTKHIGTGLEQFAQNLASDLLGNILIK